MADGQPPGVPGAPGAPAAEEPPPYPKFEEVTKGMKSDVGLFTLWYYPKEAKDKDSEKLLGQIPRGFLGEQFMLSTSVSGGGLYTGFPLDERVVRWELHDRMLVLVEPETRYLAEKGKEVSDAVRRTYPERIRVAVPVVTRTPAEDPVIDLGQLLKSPFADIGWMMGRGGDPGRINPQLSRWIKKKTFELNVEIGVELAVMSTSPPGAFDKKMVHYSFWKLPQTDYQPRMADDRVGYFLTTNQDWSKPAEERDIFNRYINRWHLVKRDPSLARCEPKQPVIFYIEKTVPVRYRQAVREGILEWNKAFDEIGFVNAVEVRQQTDDNEWRDLDPEDMRYSFFRWIVTGEGFAMGPSRANPFTGQIYDADIIFDDSMVRYYQHAAERMLPAVGTGKLNDPAWQAFVAKYPQWLRWSSERFQTAATWEQPVGDGREAQALREAVRQRMQERGQLCCDYCEGMKHQMRFASAVLAGLPQEVTDRFLEDVVKEVVTHEVGHTLGLRHNFAGSSVYSIEEIQRRRTTDEATCGSIMDYNPVLFFAQRPTEGHFITPTIGPYDHWAIEYGYRPFDATYKGAAKKAEAEKKVQADKQAAPATTTAPASAAAPPANERAMLLEIAKRSTEPELAYATDEDTTYVAPDPRSNRFDMGSDPIEWAKARFAIVDQRMKNILDWSVKDAEGWYFMRSAFLSLLLEKASVLDYVGRYVGGQYFRRAHRGDPDAAAPFVLVEPAKQRAALAFIEQSVFTDEFFAVPEDVLNHLAPHRWRHEGMSVSLSLDFPMHDVISALQSSALSDRLFPNTVRRIYDAELKSDAADKLTAAEYLQRIQAACWADAIDVQRLKNGTWTDAKPFLSSIRRSLQREYLGLVEPLVRMRPGEALAPDLHAMVQYSVQKLSADLGAVLTADPKRLDFASQAHLSECKSRIDRMLSAELREYEQTGGVMMLMGEKRQERPEDADR